MTYLDLCTHIFRSEGYPDFNDARKIRSRKAEIKTTRQLCLYFGSVFFPGKSLAALAEPFNLNHATVIHAKKTIGNDMITNQIFRDKVDKYMIELRALRQQDDIEFVIDTTHDKENVNKLLAVIDKMELVARAYCELTGKTII